jgi:hypothetical protein
MPMSAPWASTSTSGSSGPRIPLGALDLSELNGYPPGTLLMVSPGTRYAVAGVGWDPSSPGSVRITLTE